ncbi:MAG: winged helix-turn-helix domain-containing protein, partial [Fluviibacter sp.]
MAKFKPKVRDSLISHCLSVLRYVLLIHNAGGRPVVKTASLGLPLQSKNTKWNHIELLELIDEYGSINKAATSMGMSYK